VDELAAVLALLAAACFAVAATLWQKAALGLGAVSVRHPRTLLVLLGKWVWLLGLVAQVVGVGLRAAALDRGRVSIVQPLLVTAVIWALPLGYFLTHQTIGRRNCVKNDPGHAVVAVAALCLALLGAVVISSAQQKPDEADERVPEVSAPPAWLAQT